LISRTFRWRAGRALSGSVAHIESLGRSLKARRPVLTQFRLGDPARRGLGPVEIRSQEGRLISVPSLNSHNGRSPITMPQFSSARLAILRHPLALVAHSTELSGGGHPAQPSPILRDEHALDSNRLDSRFDGHCRAESLALADTTTDRKCTGERYADHPDCGRNHTYCLSLPGHCPH